MDLKECRERLKLFAIPTKGSPLYLYKNVNSGSIYIDHAPLFSRQAYKLNVPLSIEFNRKIYIV